MTLNQNNNLASIISMDVTVSFLAFFLCQIFLLWLVDFEQNNRIYSAARRLCKLRKNVKS